MLHARCNFVWPSIRTLFQRHTYDLYTMILRLFCDYLLDLFNSSRRVLVVWCQQNQKQQQPCYGLLFEQTISQPCATTLDQCMTYHCSTVDFVRHVVIKPRSSWRSSILRLYCSRSGGYGVLSTQLLTDYHHNSIIKLSVRCCVWKVLGRISQSGLTKTLKWVVVHSSATFHING